MPILHLPGEIMPGQLGPISRERRFCRVLPGAHHIQRRNALGDADDQFHLSIGGFHDRVGGKWRRHEDHRRIRPSLVDRFLHSVEDRPAFVSGAALAGSHSADDLGSVLRTGLRVECAFPPGQPLHDDSRRFIYQNAHNCLFLRMILLTSGGATRASAATTFSAASFMVSATIKFNPDCFRISRPASTLVPSRRSTIGN